MNDIQYRYAVKVTKLFSSIIMVFFTKAKVMYKNTEPYFRLRDGYILRSQIFAGGEATYDNLVLAESEAEHDLNSASQREDIENAHNWLEKIQAEIEELEQKFKQSLRNRGIDLRNSIDF